MSLAYLTPAPLMFLPVLGTSWPHPLYFLWTLFRIRILNQINSGIGRKAVCREPMHTPSCPFFACCWNWGRVGRKAHPPCLLSPRFPTRPLSLPGSPFLSANPLCCSPPCSLLVSLSTRLPSTLEDTQFLRDGSGISFLRARGYCSALCSCRNLDYRPSKGLKLQGEGRRSKGTVEVMRQESRPLQKVIVYTRS